MQNLLIACLLVFASNSVSAQGARLATDVYLTDSHYSPPVPIEVNYTSVSDLPAYATDGAVVRAQSVLRIGGKNINFTFDRRFSVFASCSAEYCTNKVLEYFDYFSLQFAGAGISFMDTSAKRRCQELGCSSYSVGRAYITINQVVFGHIYFDPTELPQGSAYGEPPIYDWLGNALSFTNFSGCLPVLPIDCKNSQNGLQVRYQFLTSEGIVMDGEYWDLQSPISATAALVPEPGTWALMIGGFGFVGFAMRRTVKPVLTRPSNR